MIEPVLSRQENVVGQGRRKRRDASKDCKGDALLYDVKLRVELERSEAPGEWAGTEPFRNISKADEH